jgi:ribonucleoside-diphosphate reductase alpha chain
MSNVIKRDGRFESVDYNKIEERIHNIVTSRKLDHIEESKLVLKIIHQLTDNIKTSTIDELLAQQCISMSSTHYNYSLLAGFVVISNHQKNTEPLFSKVITRLFGANSMVSESLFKFVMTHSETLDKACDESRDFLIDYFGFKTLEKSYLFKINGEVVERIQHMWLRVSCAIHLGDLDKALETYRLMSQKYFIHATPTLFNAGTNSSQLSSCFLEAMESDSLDGIFNTAKDVAQISKWAGGVGLHIHNVRATGSDIRGTRGKSSGIVPMLSVFNKISSYVDQGGKRNGSFAIYLEPWHADINAFLQLRKTHGDEEQRARKLFYALWIPDLFMKRVQSNAKWTLMCPNECPHLSDVYGEEFETLYQQYEFEGRGRVTINARDLWIEIMDAQMETGTPYILFKDACNRKSNQNNIGTIKSSNLCCEIIEYSDANETAVCNLASISLTQFVNETTRTFDYTLFESVVRVVARNLDNVIDINYYPIEKSKTSNNRHRPIGIGVQGLADVFLLLDLSFDSKDAAELNHNIFETLYYAAVSESCEIAKIKGHYSTFKGSPMSRGIFQMDMWEVPRSGRYDWAALQQQIQWYGLRNSLSVALMPTASTSQILGNNECFEPITSNIYVRSTMAGEFIMTNKYLIQELTLLGIWTPSVKDSIVENNGSIQHLTFIPQHVRDKYKTVWEMSMKTLVDMSIDRGAFVCQSQSLNLWIEDPSYATITKMLFYGWSKGLKTGIYYLRRRAKASAQKYSIDISQTLKIPVEEELCLMCSA